MMGQCGPSAAYTIKMLPVGASGWAGIGCSDTCEIRWNCLFSLRSCEIIALEDQDGPMWPKCSVYRPNVSICLITFGFAWFTFCSVYHHSCIICLITLPFAWFPPLAVSWIFVYFSDPSMSQVFSIHVSTAPLALPHIRASGAYSLRRKQISPKIIWRAPAKGENVFPQTVSAVGVLAVYLLY